MSSMKILHVSKKYPRALGGDAVVVANLRQQQQAAGHEVVVVTSNCNEVASDASIYKFGLKDSPARLDKITLRRLVSLVALALRMFFILNKERPDVIHTHSVDMAFCASFAARFYGIPIVHTFHIVTFYNKDQSAARQKTELWLAKQTRPHAVTAPNNYDVKKLRAAGLTQTVLLPNGVDPAFWGADTLTEGSQKFRFLAVGRLERQKGYEYLIKAASLLASTTNTPFYVTIVCEGSQKTALHKLIRALGVENSVALAGRKSPKEVRALLAQADAAVFPSLYETTPVTLLEAWAAGVPVIITSVGLLRDAPANFGAAYVVPPKDEQALTKAMSQCITDEPSRVAIAAKGHAEAQKYAWPVIAKTAEAIYRGAQ